MARAALALVGVVFLFLGDKAGAVMSDRELFEALDLTRPELASVRAAWEARDLTLAKAEFVKHLKRRPAPPGFQDYSGPPPSAQDFDTTPADQVLRHEMTSVHYTHKFEGPIDWELDPINYLEWPWQLNRHYCWLDLGRAYWATRDERYAQEFVAQMVDWVNRYPPPEDEGDQSQCWRTIEAGIRMGRTWPEAWQLFLPSPHFSGDAMLTMVKSIPDHARHIQRSRRTSNWAALECQGLFCAAVLFPEFRDSEKWRNAAVERMAQQLKWQVYPDGAQIELSTMYHQVTLGSVTGIMSLARLNNIPLPPEFLATVEKMYHFNMMMAAPNLTLPGLGDADTLDARSWLAAAPGFYPERQDFLYLASERAQGQVPPATSCEFPYAGYYLMRTGWEAGDKYLLFDAGPFGYGHQHEDMLHFVLFSDSHWHVVDPGNYAYDDSPMRQYVKSARGHNTVLVDGLEQNRRRIHDEVALAREPLAHEWHTDARCDYAAGLYKYGFGPEGAVRARHERAVFFLKPEYWVIFDRLEPEDEAEHRYQALFHLDDEVAVEGAQVLATAPNGAALRLFFAAPRGWEGISVVSGQSEPVVQGWVHLRAYECRPVPTLFAALRTGGVARLATVLYPLPAGQDCPVREVAAEDLEGGVRVRLTFRNGRTDEIYRADNKDGPIQIGKHRYPARLAYFSTDASGRRTPVRLVLGQAIE